MTSAALPRLAWSVQEVGVQLGLNYDAVLKAVHEGQIHAIRLGRHYRIPDSELTRLVGAASRQTALERDQDQQQT
jgi:excisionase family DNA binding protein